MTKHTTRDDIWHAVLEQIEETDATSSSKWTRRFDVDDIVERLESEPSRRTVRDTVATIADLGHIEDGSRQGSFIVLEEQESVGTIDVPETREIDVGDYPLEGKKIVIIQHGDTRTNGKAPARELYGGDLFEARKEYAKVEGDLWYVLTAEHGLLAPNEVVETRGASHLSEVDVKEWEDDVMDDLPHFGGSEVELLADEEFIRSLDVVLDMWAESVFYPTRELNEIDEQHMLLESVGSMPA